MAHGMSWSPDSWRARPAAQLPLYPDADALERVERRLAAAPALVKVEDIMVLRDRLAEVAAGRAFLLQGGDCAESFAEAGADKVRTTFDLLLRMGEMLGSAAGADIVHMARIAGQFAKPRSSPEESVGGVALPSYRGDAVNSPEFSAAARTPDPERLLEAYRHAAATAEWMERRSSSVRPIRIFASHEALLLNYEQALARFDAATQLWWAMSGHMIWVGDRTRDPEGAHVEFARGVANPIGVKCGPSLDPDGLMRLIDRLDPHNIGGRLVLIGRFGADRAARHLPPLMRVVRQEGRRAIWSIDPMHGNTRDAGGIKTRRLADILEETSTFFAVARAEGVHPGGIHLEMTGEDVTECVGGSGALNEGDLGRNYLSHCDPRLNQDQALEAAAAVAGLLRSRPRAADAA